MSRQVFQVIDGTEVFLTVPLTVTAKNTGKVYNVLSRIRVQQHEPTRCQCKLSKTGCGRSDFIAEFYCIVDHHTKIVPVIVAYIQHKGTKQEGTRMYLSDTAQIVTATVEDDSIDSPVYPPLY
jgi:hypothetical protein